MIKSGGYVTKKYLDETLDKKFTTFKKEITTELYDIKDEIMSELKKNRENDESHQFSHMRVNDDPQDIDVRVAKLEQRPS